MQVRSTLSTSRVCPCWHASKVMLPATQAVALRSHYDLPMTTLLWCALAVLSGSSMSGGELDTSGSISDIFGDMSCVDGIRIDGDFSGETMGRSDTHPSTPAGLWRLSPDMSHVIIPG